MNRRSLILLAPALLLAACGGKTGTTNGDTPYPMRKFSIMSALRWKSRA
jgi:hypothetical protein